MLRSDTQGRLLARILADPLDLAGHGGHARPGPLDELDAAEHQIGLPVQATARSRQAWLDADESFIREGRSRPVVPVLVDDQASTLAADLEHLQSQQEPTP